MNTDSAPKSKPKWGDQEENEEFDGAITTESVPDKDGAIHKTIVEYKTNDKKQKVKVIKRVKVYKTKVRTSKSVENRKKWKKFGECYGVPPGPEKGITTVGDEVFLELVKSQKSAENKLKKQDASSLGIVCRNCGKSGDHWTMKCPYKDKLPVPGASGVSLSDLPTATGEGSGIYIPPSKRAGARAGPGSSEATDRRGQRDEVATIRVTNLSEDTKESDLSELFRSFGPVSRIYLAKDKVSGLSKGFAFVNFVYREDAAKAIEKLSGFGYDHLILHLEWAKPSNK
jgi:translation initiation factor 3 subunit G